MIGERDFSHEVARVGVEDAKLVRVGDPWKDGDEVCVPKELIRVARLNWDDADLCPRNPRQFAIEAEPQPEPDAPNEKPERSLEPLHGVANASRRRAALRRRR